MHIIGSNSSTSEAFLEILNPKQVVISSGSKNNDFPNINCLQRILKFVDIGDIYITERDGTIWVTSDGVKEDEIKKLYDVNLDGSNSSINPNEITNEYLESIREKLLSFLGKSIVIFKQS